MKKSWTQFVITVAIILLSAVGLSLYGYQLRSQDQQTTPTTAAIPTNNQEDTQYSVLFNELSLRAEAVLVQNLSTGSIVYEKNSQSALPLASLTKLMTSFVALNYLDPNTFITFSHNAITQTGDQGFAEGEQWELKKLIPFMMTTSSNDAAYAIAEAVQKKTGTPCTTIMNQTAQDLGLHSLTFNNSTGLDINTQTSAHGNARDIAQLLVTVTERYPDIFTTSSIPQAQLGNHTGLNTNVLTESIPGFLASKTGYTESAQGNLAFIVEIGPNQPYTVVLLGSTFNGRFNDAKKIIATLYDVVATPENNL